MGKEKPVGVDPTGFEFLAEKEGFEPSIPYIADMRP